MKVLVLVGILFVALPSCAKTVPPAAPLQSDAAEGPVYIRETPYFMDGESFQFAVSLRGIQGADASLQAKVSPGKTEISHRLRTTGIARFFKVVRDTVKSTLNEDGKPTYQFAHLVFGKKVLSVETEFAFSPYRGRRRNTKAPTRGPGQYLFMNYQLPGKKRRSRWQFVPDPSAMYTGHTFLGAIRNWTPPMGQVGIFYGLSGRRIWECHLKFIGLEEVEGPRGKVLARVFEGTAQRLTVIGRVDKHRPPRQWRLHVSHDEYKLPLQISAKTEFGDVFVKMTDYQFPTGRNRIFVE